MNKKRITLLSIFVLLTLAGCQFNTQNNNTNNNDSMTDTNVEELQLSAIVSEVSGDVTAKQTDEDEFSAVTDGYELLPLGEIRTGENARARLDISDLSIVRVAPNTSFVLQASEPTEREGGVLMNLKLNFGELFVILNGGALDVDTPAGVASVTGSYMKVTFNEDSGEYEVECLEGDCAVEVQDENGQTVTVTMTAGEKAFISGDGQPLATGTMSPEDFNDWVDNNPEATVIIPAVTLTQQARQESGDGDTSTPSPTSTATQTETPTGTPTATATDTPDLTKTAAVIETIIALTPTATETYTPGPTETDIPPTETLTPTPATGNTFTINVSSYSMPPVWGDYVFIDVEFTPFGSAANPSGTMVFTPSSGEAPCTGSVGVAAQNIAGKVSAPNAVSVGAYCDFIFNTVGSRTVTMSYSGDANYPPQTTSVSVNVVKRDVNVDINPSPSAGGYVGIPLLFDAQLMDLFDYSNLPDGISVTFSSAGGSCTGTTTGGTSNAACTITFNTPGTYNVTASFSGNGLYNGASSSATSTLIIKEPTTTDLTAVTDPAYIFSPVSVTGYLVDDSLNPIAGETIVFVADDGGGNVYTCNAATGGTGYASCNMNIVVSSTYDITATYAGSATYAASGSAPPYSLFVSP